MATPNSTKVPFHAHSVHSNIDLASRVSGSSPEHQPSPSQRRVAVVANDAAQEEQKPVAKSRKAPEADFLFQNHGSICLLKPLTPAGEEWFNEHLPVDNPETQFWGGSIVIEPRYIAPILEGIQNDGLRVSA